MSLFIIRYSEWLVNDDSGSSLAALAVERHSVDLVKILQLQSGGRALVRRKTSLSNSGIDFVGLWLRDAQTAQPEFIPCSMGLSLSVSALGYRDLCRACRRRRSYVGSGSSFHH